MILMNHGCVMRQETVQNLNLRYRNPEFTSFENFLSIMPHNLCGEIFWILIKGKEQLLIKIEPPVQALPPTKFEIEIEFLEYLNDTYWSHLTEEELEEYHSLYKEENPLEYLSFFEWFKMREMYSNATFDLFAEYFNGDWRKGQEIHKVVITKRLYQISPDLTQAWFSNSNFYKIKALAVFKKYTIYCNMA